MKSVFREKAFESRTHAYTLTCHAPHSLSGESTLWTWQEGHEAVPPGTNARLSLGFTSFKALTMLLGAPGSHVLLGQDVLCSPGFYFLPQFHERKDSVVSSRFV